MKVIINSDKEQLLCISCGLCCDGSIFEHAEIVPEDKAGLLEKGCFLVKEKDGKRFFPLPCHHLHDRKCDIYSLWRPRICSAFRCRVLRRLSNKEISFEQAMQIIELTISHIAEVRRQIQSVSHVRTINIFELFELWKNHAEDPDSVVMLNFAALQFRLCRDFGKDENRKMEKGYLIEPE